ncbi:hypothetical protein L2Y96_18005 [Luteibacter aegosomaticola]|uniref:hypothetical protein n=1 Tax=Luteibacter aegosomaticola TaxID=2911538 RepID=UPI001FF87199|nr:hypothetical protein [Luteibacter aegosomaticola]UPG89273.1 hypothetical protein L2Y96_18005 [Luteibacter aegosomaticola]
MTAAPGAPVKAVKVIVATGRSVTDLSGVRKGPGEEASVDARDIRWLRKLGFILGKDEEAVAYTGRFTITAADGPAVRLA